MTQNRIEKEEKELLKRARLGGGRSLMRCEDCNRMIAEERCKAVKGVRTCIKCQREREAE